MTLCLFPFEHNFYHKNNIRSLLVGHPLVANIKKEIQTGVSRDNTLDSIALMPGSRSHEIKYHLPIMIDIANVVSRKKSNISFKFILPNDFWGKKVEAMIKAYQIEFNYLIYTNNQYRQLSESKLAIIASGTAALESALLGVPTAVIYKTHWLNYLIFSLFGVTKREFYSLPNIIFQREYFKEFIGMTINKAQLKSHIFELLNLNKNNISSFKDGQSYLLNTLSPIDEKLIVKAILDL
jgi:lipid-A-disaccharide synthase